MAPLGERVSALEAQHAEVMRRLDEMRTGQQTVLTEIQGLRRTLDTEAGARKTRAFWSRVSEHGISALLASAVTWLVTHLPGSAAHAG